MATVLVTGATGIVGSEVVEVLRRDGHRVTAVSAHGSEDGSVIKWRMGTEPRPVALPTPDVVVHAAADTRWNLSEENALLANVKSLKALSRVVPRSTRLVLLSTAHAIGYGTGDRESVLSFRNTYEWSKSAAETLLEDSFDNCGVVRFPIVIGRRSDGYVTRLAGLMKLFKPLVSGLIPAIVGQRDALLDLVPVDDVAEQVAAVACSELPLAPMEVIGHGAEAPTVEEVFEALFDTLDLWRASRAIAPLVRPPIVEPDRWDRFHLPFARDQLTPIQLRLVEVMSEYRPYLCLREPFKVDVQLKDPLNSFRTSVRWWADNHSRAAAAVAESW